MFFDWFGVESSDESFGLFSVGHSAWDALDYIPIVLLVAIVAALVLAALRLTNAIHKALVPASAVVAVLGIVSALLIFYRIVDPPSFGSFGTPFGTITAEGTVQFPVFLALLAAVGIAFGGCRAVQELRARRPACRRFRR